MRARIRSIPCPLRLGLVALLLVVAPAAAHGFHDGGVGSCSRCHVMHESADGELVVAGEALIGAATPTDVCLGCHATSAGGVFASDPLAPGPERGGGNFAYLLEDDLHDGPDAGLVPIPGHAAGHNLVAPGAGLTADPVRTTAPGGSFPAAALGCTSCHDPHGNASFRMLHGAGPVQGGRFWFTAAAPEAEGIALDGPPEGPTNHTAYRSGWVDWCGNCHDPRYHQMGQSAFSHPVDRGLGAPVATRYDAYRGDADPTGGTGATSYLPQVPFEDPAQTVNSTAGPFGGSRLSCMTCHRAHASSAPAAGRWDFGVVTLETDGVASGSLALPNPYPGLGQRSLCLKCHDVSHDAGAPCLSCHREAVEGGTGDPLVPIGN